ncbi:Cytochrome b6-f complex iron-sulfur subunit 1 [Nocardioides dokdonensis FR1436]|uniref:Cytochrome b6-f complex iron-sulfur subunit 1 n=1 Tax=Nocardioides dokdonensis FR1436 TaxID=1300347 RepID=A0A1A9GLQ3_9ACTN|nr:FAD-dependent oxidoreductase [Nocardioides dokdonensis]ANH38411.1 Cytochrome b6-f complex iron-sulfur subunit 1 [Nocardioides dokdonensis FR1436]
MSAQSVWWQRRGDPPTQPEGPDSPGPDEVFDAVVVGAGVTGLATALELVRAGRSVLVVEARHPGAVTSGRTTGKVSALQGTTLSELRRKHGDSARVPAYVDSSLAALDWVAAFCEEHRVATSRRDALTYAASRDEVPTVREEHEAALSLGLPVRYETAPDLPVPAHAATVLPDQLQLDPVELVLAMLEQVRSGGGRLLTGRRVQRLRQRGEVVHVLGEDGLDVRGRHVVLATGAPVVDRRMHFARLTAQRSYLMAFSHPDPPEVMALSAGSPGRSWRGGELDGRRLLLVGGEGHETGRGPRESSRVDRLREWSQEHFPDAVELGAWSAQDYMSLDGLPLVGGLGGPSSSVSVATGYRKWGLTSGIAAGIALAGAQTGSPAPWADELYTRLPRLRDLPAFLGVQAGVTLGEVGALASGVRRPPSRAAVEAGGCAALPVCTHLGGTLRWNDHEQTYDCPLHGSRFSADGEVLEGPATRSLARVPALPRLPGTGGRSST